MHKHELLRRISELEARNRALIEENERLRETLGLPLKDVAAPEAASTHKLEEPATENVGCILPVNEPTDSEEKEVNEIPTTLLLVPSAPNMS